MAEETQAWPGVASWLFHSSTENWGASIGVGVTWQNPNATGGSEA